VMGYGGTNTWFNYTVNVTSAGQYTFSLRAGSQTRGVVHLSVDGTPVTSATTVPAAGAWDTAAEWETVAFPGSVLLAVGRHVVQIYIDQANVDLNQLTVAPTSFNYVQGNSATPQTSQVVPVAYNSAQTAGNLNVVFVAWNNNSGSVSGITDTSGNMYTKAVGPTINNTPPVRSQEVWYCSNIQGGSNNTVKVTMSSAEPYIDIRILEYRGPGTYDTSLGAIGNSATASSGTVTTTANNELLVSGTYSDAGTTGAGAGFKQRIKTVNWASAEDEVAGTAGSYSDSTSLVKSTVWVSQMVAFKPRTRK